MISLKDLLPVFPWDKLSHYQWASWFSAAASVVALAAVAAYSRSLPLSLFAASAASAATAYAAGKLGEASDQEANDVAAAEGRPMPHEVDEADVRASFLGCLPSAVPMLAAGVAASLLAR